MKITNAVIVERIEGLSNLTNEKFDESNSQYEGLEKQVRLTNGRVRLLEKAIWGLGGGIAVLTVFAVPLIVDYLKDRL